jgi:hypothetical protein
VVDASTGDAWVWARMRRKFREKCPLVVTRSHGLEHVVHLENLEEVQTGKLALIVEVPPVSRRLPALGSGYFPAYADLAWLLNRRDLEYAVEKLGVKPERIASRCQWDSRGISESDL